MTYREARAELFELATQAARVLNQFDGVERETLHSLHIDDLFDLVTNDVKFDEESLREVFGRVCHDFWLRENDYSVKAPPALRVVADLPDVTEPEFELLAYPDGRNDE